MLRVPAAHNCMHPSPGHSLPALPGAHRGVVVGKQELCIVRAQAAGEGCVDVAILLRLDLPLLLADSLQQLLKRCSLLALVLPGGYEVPRRVVVAGHAGGHACAAAAPGWSATDLHPRASQ